MLLIVEMMTCARTEEFKGGREGPLNVAPGGSGTAPIVEKIDKIERQIPKEKLMIVDDDEKPLYKTDSTSIAESDSEVEKVFNETAVYMASTSLKNGSDNSYGTNSFSGSAPIVEKIDKIERQIPKEKLMIVDDDENPLYKTDSTSIAESDSEVEKVFNETAVYMASTSLKNGSDSSYGTNSLLQQ
nr:hypothetical protein [Tanacetum cinerariifolium]